MSEWRVENKATNRRTHAVFLWSNSGWAQLCIQRESHKKVARVSFQYQVYSVSTILTNTGCEYSPAFSQSAFSSTSRFHGLIKQKSIKRERKCRRKEVTAQRHPNIVIFRYKMRNSRWVEGKCISVILNKLLMFWPPTGSFGYKQTSKEFLPVIKVV